MVVVVTVKRRKKRNKGEENKKNNNNRDEDTEAAHDYVAEISHVHHSNRNDATIIARPTSF